MAARYEGGEISPAGWWLYAPASSAAVQPVYLERDAFVEPGVVERVVLPPERPWAASGVHREDGERVPPKVGVGRPCGGAEEARPASLGAREAAPGQGHRGYGGDGVPQEELAPSGAATGIYVRDDPKRPLGRDEDAGGADISIGHRRPGREDDALGIEEFPGGADAP